MADKRRKNLLKFRQAFRQLTSDGQFPPERQHRLYHWCQAALLDWDEARRFIREDAIAFFRQYVAKNSHDVEDIQRLQKRLLLEDIDPFVKVPKKLHVIIFVIFLVATVGPGACTIFSLGLVALNITSEIAFFFPVVASLVTTFLLVWFVWNHFDSLQQSRKIPRKFTDYNQSTSLPKPENTSTPTERFHDPQNIPTQPLTSSQSSTPRDTTPVLNVRDLKRYVAKLSPTGFEHWVLQILTFTGWERVTMAGGAADRGVDLRGTYRGEPCIVQCKHYQTRNVTPREVRELIGTLHIQRVPRAILVTSGTYTSQCYQETAGHPVELWDIDTLVHHIRETLTKEPHKPIPQNLMTNYLQHPPSA
jgi:HJR/Mrr/RecB family endonuclease